MGDASDRKIMTLLADLKTLMHAKGFDAYLVPRADLFGGEEVRPCDERLRAISGFDGSAGCAVVRVDGKSDLLVDSRYIVQARAQVDHAQWQVHEGGLSLIASTLENCRIAYDPWLFTPVQLEPLSSLNLHGDLVNLVDQVWPDRPPHLPHQPYELPLDLVGVSSAEKRTAIAAACDGRSLLITQSDALAWLMNWRGQDLKMTPVALAFGVLSPDGQVKTFAPEDREALLAYLKGRQVQYDLTTTSCALVTALGAQGTALPCPIRAAKAVKNAAEIQAIRTAHRADAHAVTQFLQWFESEEKTTLTELDLVAKLEGFRSQNPAYHGPSFSTICGSGPNGALPHYRVCEKSNRRLREGDFVVLDSGGQYPGATTDVTRTLAVGPITAQMRHDFTLVLQGMIALTLQCFPAGTTGHQLDVLARSALWNAHLDYGHGTGHGVGAGLCVHEAPPNVSPHPRIPAGNWALKPGMIFSNEPGFYRQGAQGYGIRCENLLLVVERAPGWYGFETLTHIPFDLSLVDFDLLTPAQSKWLKEYQDLSSISS